MLGIALFAALANAAAAEATAPAVPTWAISAQEPGDVATPVWSSDGRLLAWSWTRARVRELRVASVERLDAPQVSPIALAGADGGYRAWGAPSFGPQGSLIFVAGIGSGDTRAYYALRLANPDAPPATELIAITDMAGNVESITGAHRMALVATQPDEYTDVYVLEPATGALSRVTSSWDRELDLALTTDGRTLAASVHTGAGVDLMAWDLPDPRPATPEPTKKKKKRKRSEPAPVSLGIRDLALEPTRQIDLPGDQVRPVWAGDEIVCFSSTQAGWDLIAVRGDDTTRVLAADVRLPGYGPPAVSDDGAWVAWTAAIDQRVHVARRDGTAHRVVRLAGVESVEDPALTVRDGSLWVAVTALVPGERFRRIHVADLGPAR